MKECDVCIEIPIVIGAVSAASGTFWWWHQEARGKPLRETSWPDLTRDPAVYGARELKTGPFSLASILVAIGMACLWKCADTDRTFEVSRQFIALFGFISVVAGALLVDAVMDHSLKLDRADRWYFLNGGYILFAGMMAFVAWWLCWLGLRPADFSECFGLRGWATVLVTFSLLWKVMSNEEDKGLSLLSLILSSTWVWTAAFTHEPSKQSHLHVFAVALLFAGFTVGSHSLARNRKA
jgi:hypothetical protein